MQVAIELPRRMLRSCWAATGKTHGPLEAVLVTAVREARISRAEARRILGMSRYEMDGLLKRYGAASDFTIADLERDTESALACRAE